MTSRGASEPAPQVRAPTPTCPDSIPLEEPLDVDYGTPLHARNWLPELTPRYLGYQPASMGLHVGEAFRKTLSLASGAVELLGSAHERGVGLVLFSPQAGGYCVINHWSTWYSTRPDFSLASSWTSPDRRMAILLLKVVVGAGTADAQPRWVVLGTDGRRAWVALGKPPEDQLLVPTVRLRPVGRSLYLDVTQHRVSHYPLGKNGHFVTGAN